MIHCLLLLHFLSKCCSILGPLLLITPNISTWIVKMILISTLTCNWAHIRAKPWFANTIDSFLVYFFLFWNVTHSGSRSSKTFKPKKNIPEGSHQYELLKHAEATLGSGNLRMAVMLPEGEDLNEWVAVNSKCQVYLTPPPLVLPRLYHFLVIIPGRDIWHLH